MRQILLYSVFLAIVSLAACENDIAEVAAFDDKNTGVEKADSIEAIYSQIGIVKGRLISPYMERHIESAKPYAEFPKGLHVDFYEDSTLQVTGTLDADYGKYFDVEGDILLKKHVVFINFKEKRRLDCEELRWDAKKAKFISETNIRISTPTDTLYGTGMQTDQNFKNYEIYVPRGSLPGEFMNVERGAEVSTDSTVSNAADTAVTGLPKPPAARDSFRLRSPQIKPGSNKAKLPQQ
ncbi:LPS export ABC transporter periplasmic protein LptC [Chitinophaga caeni]|uniref:LPS export ABC transporter periplasmic protein LptC n=1 Tax=Chitinophaga caeni TaxID=2029983 RepID=A0A291QQS1_9BACT|nr:LPS export ABC transporter periplasmic protein LptC [Chitinophaga caeni]ATL46359.1 LPS export ABC transporter periplasmic protein LptC [Chitinophaga caeni]